MARKHIIGWSLGLLTLGLGLQLTAAVAAAPARDAIVRHVDTLAPVLAQQSSPRETLLGMILGVDEAKGQITIEIASGIDGTFKVQDGLIFNAVHHGDYVEASVETIGGTKTIVALKKL